MKKNPQKNAATPVTDQVEETELKDTILDIEPKDGAPVDLIEDALPESKDVSGFGDDDDDDLSLTSKKKLHMGNRDMDEPAEYFEEEDDDDEGLDMDGGD